MPLIPKAQDEPESKSTPAQRLRRKHIRVTGQASKISDFTKLLKTYPYHDIDAMLTWVSKQPNTLRSTLTSGLFVHKYPEFLALRATDLEGYQYGEEAEGVARDIATTGADPIPPEFVQHCCDEFVKFLVWLKAREEPVAKILYESLPPASVFASIWFAKVVPKYSKKFRKFDVMNPKFQQFLLAIVKGSDEPLSFIRLMNVYNECSGTAGKA
jgi:hypothetical protein